MSTFQKALCDRCSTGHLLTELRPDGENSSLMVCEKCYDLKWRYRKVRIEPPGKFTRAEADLSFPTPSVEYDLNPSSGVVGIGVVGLMIVGFTTT